MTACCAAPFPLTGTWAGAVIAAIPRLRPTLPDIPPGGVIIASLLVGVVAFGIASIYDLLTA